MSTSQPAADAALAAYQARLLDILHRGSDGRAMADEINAASGPIGENALGPLDPDLVEVAARLTRQWGRLR